MQRNNKYLIPTIWIATIAFIGAGAVGWGSMDFGDRTSSIAKVGDVPISKLKFNYMYNNLYLLESQKRNGKFDREMAKKLGLEKSVFDELVREALLLNLAKEYGIIVTDKEVALEITSYDIFKDKNGVFHKEYYENFLKSRGLKAKEFEDIIRDQLKVKKIVKLLNVKPLEFEKEVIGSTFRIGDKIKYDILEAKDINVTIDDNELKEYWAKNKLEYLTPTRYKLQLLWTKPKDINFTQEEIEKFYKENSFEYVDKEGKTKPLSEVKDEVIKALTLQKLKKDAIIERSRFKKGKLSPTEVVTLDEGDKIFTPQIWKEIKDAKENDILKPKVVDNSYVTIKLEKVIKPQEMKFEEAKELVKRDLTQEKRREELFKKAQELQKNPSKLKFESKDYITLSTLPKLEGLIAPESFEVTKALFGSSKKSDIVNLGDKLVVYHINEQKLLDKNPLLMEKEISDIKSGELYYNLITDLSKKYKIEKFVKGL
ncbi:MAG: hypothetical protein GXN91_03465 [Epsilonproteobacteria bacterium]|nr:hypothetical protein [Campylobacterota bacterium]